MIVYGWLIVKTMGRMVQLLQLLIGKSNKIQYYDCLFLNLPDFFIFLLNYLSVAPLLSLFVSFRSYVFLSFSSSSSSIFHYSVWAEAVVTMEEREVGI